MPGTTSGAKRAAETLKKKDPNFYRKVGSIGGRARHVKPRGFAANPDLAQTAGRLGGLKSRRGKSVKTEQRVQRAKKMRSDGATLREIANELNVSVSTARHYLKEY